ncbi:MAG: methionyl-tRNA formyltransferase [Parvularculaceae bacterium]|nr:methionyl-tRNA formyltransferase [Parvularculaceae bacterium]
MALVRSFERKDMERNSVHKEIGATYTVFKTDDRVFLQIDAYGSSDREIPGKKSQSLQLDERGAAALFQIIRREFGF